MIYNVSLIDNETPLLVSSVIENIFHDLSIQCKPISAKRIGRIGPLPRPIVVELSSPSRVRMILKTKSKMRFSN